MINQNRLRYLANLTFQNCHFSPPCHPQLNFQINKGNRSSRESDHSLQQGQLNSNGTIILEEE